MNRLILLLLFALPSFFSAMCGERIDEGKAVEYCDTSVLNRIEGIWEFPGDDTRVLIRRVIPTARLCDIIVVDSPDCRLTPGDVIGSVRPSAEAGTYELSICRSLTKGVFTDPGHCVARLKDNDASLTFEPRKISIRIGNLYFLPKFWRMIRFRFTQPDAEIPQGMIKVYPPAYSAKVTEPVYL